MMTIKPTKEVVAAVNELFSLQSEEIYCEDFAKELSKRVLISERSRADALKLYNKLHDNAKANVAAVQKAMGECKDLKDIQVLVKERQQYILDLKCQLSAIENS